MMKKSLISKLSIITVLSSLLVTTSYAQTATNCRDSFAPRFLCETYSDFTNNFGILSLIRLVLTALITILVLFVLWQIVKAIFSWLTKAGDEKARGSAIKSISNAVVGVVITGILLVGFFIFNTWLFPNGGIPNPLYACFDNVFLSSKDLDPDTGTLKNSDKRELANTIVYEGIPVTKAAVNQSTNLQTVNQTLKVFNETFGGNFDVNAVKFMQDNLYCLDKSTGAERSTGYVILKRVGINK